MTMLRGLRSSKPRSTISSPRSGSVCFRPRQRLQETEAEIDRLKRASKPAPVESLLPQLPALIRKHVATIERFAQHDPLRARAAVRQALQTDLIVLRPAEHGRHVIAYFGLDPVAIATGTEAENVVAGAGFEPATFGL